MTVITGQLVCPAFSSYPDDNHDLKLKVYAPRSLGWPHSHQTEHSSARLGLGRVPQTEHSSARSGFQTEHNITRPGLGCVPPN